MENANQDTWETVNEAQRLFAKAIDLDPDLAPAYAMAAYCYVLRKASGWIVDRECELAEAARLAHRAVQLGKDDAGSLSRAGHTLAFVVHDLDSATFCIDRALVLNPNLASAWFSSGWLRIRTNEPDVCAMGIWLEPTVWRAPAGAASAVAGRTERADDRRNEPYGLGVAHE